MATELRGNSFNLVPRLDVPRPAGASCPLAPGVGTVDGAPEPARAVFLRLKDRMRLFVTESAGFTLGELARAKALGQIYVDRSSKDRPDDFAADLAALSRLPECSGCPREAACPGGFRASSAEPFARARASTLAYLATLEGDVLDVGAGDAPYASALAPRISAGRVRYLALDPDGERLALLRSRHPWAEVTTHSLEALDRRFRHVLFLRSLNHLPDAGAALALAAARLEPGGRLLAVDDVAFGLVRATEHAARAERSAARFEHYRLDSAEEVLAAAAGLPLELLERRDVGPGSSNEWLLLWEKR